MKLKTFSEAFRSKPFRSFNLRMADGESIPILHPETVFQSPSEPRTVIVTRREGGFVILDIESVQYLEFTPLEKKESS